MLTKNIRQEMCELCNSSINNTDRQFESKLALCRAIFRKKMEDYSPSWRVMRPSSLTDQIYIKVKRIRGIEEGNKALVDDDIKSELVGIVNYGIMALIQLEHGYADYADKSKEWAFSEYDKYSKMVLELMKKKNHDYQEAWRGMRTTSYTDFILTKIERTKQIEDNNGKTLVSEGIDANYMDMINYAIFGLIREEER